MTIQTRNPDERELFQGLARAMHRLGDDYDDTAAAIQRQMQGKPNFETAARDLDVQLSDLVEVFCDEMLKLGFTIGPARKQ